MYNTTALVNGRKVVVDKFIYVYKYINILVVDALSLLTDYNKNNYIIITIIPNIIMFAQFFFLFFIIIPTL